MPDSSSSYNTVTNLTQFRVGVSALIFREGKILLAHRSDIDWWNLPGGGMELGETLEVTVRREVLEETGLQIEVERLVGVYSKPQKQEIVLSFLCRIIGGQLTSTDESRECRFFSPDALPPNTLPKHRQRISDALLNEERTLIRDQLTTSSQDQGLSRS